MAAPNGVGHHEAAMPLVARPNRKLDLITLEGLEKFVDTSSEDRHLLKSRAFPEMQDSLLKACDVQVVLYDRYSLDSFAACLAAQQALGERAVYCGTVRGGGLAELPEKVDIYGKVVAMVGLCWSLEALHELAMECTGLFILETYQSADYQLAEFGHPTAVLIVEPKMSAGPLAWNFFLPGQPVPLLLRAIEDMELGRHALKHAADFARGFEAAITFTPPSGEVLSHDAAFRTFLQHVDEGEDVLRDAAARGRELSAEVAALCAAASSYEVRVLQLFPAWKCAVVEQKSAYSRYVAEDLARRLAARCGEGSASRCLGVVYERKPFGIRVELRSLPGGPDVSQIVLAMQDGAGRAHRGFFFLSCDRDWESIWLQPEPVLWDVSSAGASCLELGQNQNVVVMARQQRFPENPADEWSWGFLAEHPEVEGWIPTLAHTLFVAPRSLAAPGEGVQPLEAGELVIAKCQQGDFVFGDAYRHPGDRTRRPGWFRRGGNVLCPVQPLRARAFLTTCLNANAAAAA